MLFSISKGILFTPFQVRIEIPLTPREWSILEKSPAWHQLEEAVEEIRKEDSHSHQREMQYLQGTQESIFPCMKGHENLVYSQQTLQKRENIYKDRCPLYKEARHPLSKWIDEIYSRLSHRRR